MRAPDPALMCPLCLAKMNVVNAILVRFRVFDDELRDFQKILALADHSRNCQFVHHVFVRLHLEDPPNRISPFSELVQR